MIAKLIKIVIITALVLLVTTIFPVTYEWCKIAVDWIISQGEWGILAIIACIFAAVFS